MRRLQGFLALGVAACLAVPCVTRASSYTVTPSDLAAGKSDFAPPHGTGTKSFGYDWDSAKPDTSAGGAPGFDNSSFSASVTNNAGPAADEYRTFRVSLDGLTTSGGAVKVNELSSFSYYNDQQSGSNAWRVTIYTATEPGDSASWWYHSRIQVNPTAVAGGGWSLLDSSALTFSEKLHSGSDVTVGSWSDVLTDYGSQRIMMIDFTLGADNGGGTESARLDGITFSGSRFTGGAAQLNLEAVPLPASAWMGFGLIGLLGAKGLMRRKPAVA